MRMHKRWGAAVLALLAASSLLAEATLSTVSVENHMGYLGDSSVGVGASAEAVTFGNPAFRACVTNEDASNILLVQWIPVGTSVTASQLTTPPNATVTQVQPIDPTGPENGILCTPGDRGRWAGLIWQSKTSAVAAHVRWTY